MLINLPKFLKKAFNNVAVLNDDEMFIPGSTVALLGTCSTAAYVEKLENLKMPFYQFFCTTLSAPYLPLYNFDCKENALVCITTHLRGCLKSLN